MGLGGGPARPGRSRPLPPAPWATQHFSIADCRATTAVHDSRSTAVNGRHRTEARPPSARSCFRACTALHRGIAGTGNAPVGRAGRLTHVSRSAASRRKPSAQRSDRYDVCGRNDTRQRVETGESSHTYISQQSLQVPDRETIANVRVRSSPANHLLLADALSCIWMDGCWLSRSMSGLRLEVSIGGTSRYYPPCVSCAWPRGGN